VSLPANSILIGLSTCRTAFPAQHLRPQGVLSCWPDGLELSRILSGIQRAAQTVFGVYFKRTYSRDTSASSALGVLNDNPLYKSTHSFTHSHVITKRPSCSQSIRSVYALVVNLVHDPCQRLWRNWVDSLVQSSSRAVNEDLIYR